MAELVDAVDSKSTAARLAGSSPAWGTTLFLPNPLPHQRRSAPERRRGKGSEVYDRTLRTPTDEFHGLSGLYASDTQLVDQAARITNMGRNAAGSILIRAQESLGVVAA